MSIKSLREVMDGQKKSTDTKVVDNDSRIWP